MEYRGYSYRTRKEGYEKYCTRISKDGRFIQKAWGKTLGNSRLLAKRVIDKLIQDKDSITSVINEIKI